MDEEEIERIDFIAGEVHALVAATIALIKAHPDREKLRAHLIAARAATEARTLPVAVTEHFLDGVADAFARFEKA